MTLKHLAIYSILLTMPCFAMATDSGSHNGPIVVTIKPLYSLVAQLSKGIEKPVLLMKQMPSPHHYSMRPSERRLLSNARMIVWVGPQMESYLSKTISQQETHIVSALQASGLKLLKRRMKTHTHAEGAVSIDPHIWLSTNNAIAISQHLTQQLIASDPENTAKYKMNLQQLHSKILMLRSEIQAQLQDYQQPFITYHDAFQYFEDEFDLNYIDSINFDEETNTSLKHLQHIRTSIEKNNVQCLVYQPPKPKIIQSIMNKSTTTSVSLDPLGQAIHNDDEAWFGIMRDIAHNFKRCLNRRQTN